MSLLSGIHSADAQRQDMPSVYSVYSWDIVTTGVNITLIDTLHLKPISLLSNNILCIGLPLVTPGRALQQADPQGRKRWHHLYLVN